MRCCWARRRLVGNRLIELAWPHADGAETFLAAPSTEFIIPAPTLAVRRAIESLRAAGNRAAPPRARGGERPAQCARVLMKELRAAGVVLGVPGLRSEGGYDPEVYTAVYLKLLEHRHARALTIDESWPVAVSPYELAMNTVELHPSPAEVQSAMDHAEAVDTAQTEHDVRNWFR